MTEPNRATPDTDAEVPYAELSRTLRQLARQLVGDAQRADDLVQEAWVAALGRRPDQVHDLTAWLRSVVRNLASRSHRRRLHRRDAEVLAAASEAVASEERLVEQASTYRMLRGATDELAEPQRSVVLARFFEGRSVESIVQGTGRSNTTVRRIIKRGLDDLRMALDRKHHGQRSVWGALLARSLRDEGPATGVDAGRGVEVASEGASGLHGGLWLAGLAVIPLTLWLGSRLLDDRPEPRTVQVAEVLAPLTSGPTQPPDEAVREAVGAAPTSRGAGGEPAAAPAAPAAEPTGHDRTLEVNVFRADGTPAAGAELRVRTPGREEVVFADEAGRALLSYPQERLFRALPDFDPDEIGCHLRALVEGEAWSHTLVVAIPEEGRSLDLFTRGACFDLHGLVVDEDGSPIVAALVNIEEDGRESTARREDGVLFTSLTMPLRTDEAGRFRYEALPRRPHRVNIGAEGFAPFDQLVDPGDQRSAGEIEQRFIMTRGSRVSGRVRLPGGGPAAGARVWVPDVLAELRGEPVSQALCDDQGLYSLEGVAPGERYIFATLPERPELVAFNLIDVPPAGSGAWDAMLAADEGVRVRIEDTNGTPVNDACVVLAHEDPPEWGHVIYTDPQGRAHFAHVPTGELTVLVIAPWDPRTLTFACDREREENVFQVPAGVTPGGLLQGTLIDDLGLLEMGTSVVGASSEEFFTTPVDANSGHFAVTLEPGSYDVLVIVEGLGATPLGTFELQAGARLDMASTPLPAPQLVELHWSTVVPDEARTWALTAVLDWAREPTLLALTEAVDQLELLPGGYRLVPPQGDPDRGVRFDVHADTAGEATVVVIP